MKLDNVKKMIKMTKNIMLFSPDEGAQWISNGHCAVSLYGLPNLTEQNIYRILSIEENEGAFYFSNCPYMPLSTEDMKPDEYDSDSLMERIEINVIYHGTEYTPFNSLQGAILLPSKYIALFGDVRDMRFVRRDSQIAVFDGFVLMGYIAPAKFRDTELAEHIKALDTALEIAKANRMTIAPDEAEQLDMEDQE